MHSIIKTTLSIALITLCLWALNKASANRMASSDIAKQLPTIITQDERPFNGIIMVKRNNQPLFTYISGEQVNQQSQFVIASLSKQVIAALVLQAADAGKVKLTQSINHYLGTYQTDIPNSVTVSQLLSHTSGLISPNKAPVFTPGTRFKYSNYGYTLLGQLLEQVNQKPLAAQINALNINADLGGLNARLGKTSAIKISQPSLILGQTETRVKSPTNSQSHHASPGELTSHYTDSDVEITADLLAPGGIVASADAYSRFQHALFTGQLISDKNLQQMTTPHITREHRWGTVGYGYGTQISQQDGITEYSHSGYLPGYVSLALYYPQSKVNVVILENTSWDLQHPQRTFGLHDKIRNSIYSKVIALDNRPVAKLYQSGKSAISDAFTATE
ncbi:serine hydrolase domain-containing protein [Shewanella youngdeokensis]|uniref:Serine hydrolase domain-containing protein n=1 Tax=Shewanella youngdeokensis TaxID=2999068 RepID=A0ABZ0JVP6_9GAMM|nr:serine hydrolase domain-containing protein [Shewanella sp. DAU334]